MRAIWNGEVIAESDDTVSLEGNQYFPVEAVRTEFLLPSETHTNCAWKGLASYHSLKVGDKINRDAAWYYPDPKPAASEIKGRVAFWRGVKVDKGATLSRPVDVPAGASCDLDTAGSAGVWGLRGLVDRLTGRSASRS